MKKEFWQGFENSYVLGLGSNKVDRKDVKELEAEVLKIVETLFADELKDAKNLETSITQGLGANHDEDNAGSEHLYGVFKKPKEGFLRPKKLFAKVARNNTQNTISIREISDPDKFSQLRTLIEENLGAEYVGEKIPDAYWQFGSSTKEKKVTKLNVTPKAPIIETPVIITEPGDEIPEYKASEKVKTEFSMKKYILRSAAVIAATAIILGGVTKAVFTSRHEAMSLSDMVTMDVAEYTSMPGIVKFIDPPDFKFTLTKGYEVLVETPNAALLKQGDDVLYVMGKLDTAGTKGVYFPDGKTFIQKGSGLTKVFNLGPFYDADAYNNVDPKEVMFDNQTAFRTMFEGKSSLAFFNYGDDKDVIEKEGDLYIQAASKRLYGRLVQGQIKLVGLNDFQKAGIKEFGAGTLFGELSAVYDYRAKTGPKRINGYIGEFTVEAFLSPTNINL